jgi:hypothetical protein
MLLQVSEQQVSNVAYAAESAASADDQRLHWLTADLSKACILASGAVSSKSFGHGRVQHVSPSLLSFCAGSPCGGDGDAVGGDDDDCFNIELDSEPPDQSETSRSLRQALNLLNSGTPDSIEEGLQLVEDHIGDKTWRKRFLAQGELLSSLFTRNMRICRALQAVFTL